MKLKNKRTKPCKECPFAKKNNLAGPNPGGASVATYIGQSMGPFWLPCHMEKEYDGKNTDPSKVNQCAGAAIYRSNVNASEMPEQLLRLPKDKETVFGSHVEFAVHYLRLPEKMVKPLLTEEKVHNLMLREFVDSQAKQIKI
jgi:hypothetical protein